MIPKAIQAHLVSLSCHLLLVIQDAVTNLKSKCKTSCEMGPIYRSKKKDRASLSLKDETCAGLCWRSREVIKKMTGHTMQTWVMGFCRNLPFTFICKQPVWNPIFQCIYIYSETYTVLTWIKPMCPTPLLHCPVLGEMLWVPHACCEKLLSGDFVVTLFVLLWSGLWSVHADQCWIRKWE